MIQEGGRVSGPGSGVGRFLSPLCATLGALGGGFPDLRYAHCANEKRAARERDTGLLCAKLGNAHSAGIAGFLVCSCELPSCKLRVAGIREVGSGATFR